ncbi:MAG: ATP-grasp domain-containing protein [Lachnospiraceae bacterium]|nr:ATP-grasp domain-containing protein [Lachnospiraceae bacterium]
MHYAWQTDKKVSFSDEEHQWIEAAVKKLKSNFVTMDIARREDGKLIIMELGDGQVSGLLQIKAADFYRAFNPDVLIQVYQLKFGG